MDEEKEECLFPSCECENYCKNEYRGKTEKQKRGIENCIRKEGHNVTKKRIGKGD